MHAHSSRLPLPSPSGYRTYFHSHPPLHMLGHSVPRMPFPRASGHQPPTHPSIPNPNVLSYVRPSHYTSTHPCHCIKRRYNIHVCFPGQTQQFLMRSEIILNVFSGAHLPKHSQCSINICSKKEGITYGKQTTKRIRQTRVPGIISLTYSY